MTTPATRLDDNALNFARELVDPNFSLSVPNPAKVAIGQLLAEITRLRDQQSEVLKYIDGEATWTTECGDHPDGHTFTVGGDPRSEDLQHIRALIGDPE